MRAAAISRLAAATALALLIAIVSVPATASAGVPPQKWTGVGRVTTLPAGIETADVKQVAVGSYHVLVLLNDGTLATSNQFGTDTYNVGTIPSALNGKTVVAISAGHQSSFAVTSEGDLIGWGWNGNGQISLIPNVGGLDFVEVHAGFSDVVALLSDGTVRGWGTGGNVSTIPSALAGKTVTQLSYKGDHAVALLDTGKLVSWGNRTPAYAVVPTALNDEVVTQIDTAANHTLALLDDGTVASWGYFNRGDVPTELTDGSRTVVEVAATQWGSFALLNTGEVVSWAFVDVSSAPPSIPAIFDSRRVIDLESGSESVFFKYFDLGTLSYSTGGFDPFNGPVAPGSTIEIAGTAFQANVAVKLDFRGATQTISTNEEGDFDVDLAVPDDAEWATEQLTVTIDNREYGGAVQISAQPLTAVTPLIVGAPRVGQKLTVDTSGWTSGVKLDYQWYRDGKRIRTAVGASYTPVAADRTHVLHVKVAASKTGFATVSKVSAKTSKLAYGVLAVTTPVVDGTLHVGQVLTANTGAWTPAPTFRYQWYVNGSAVKKATKRTFAVPASAVGGYVRVVVTGSVSGYTSVTRLARATSTIGLGSFTATPNPTITGVVQTGKTLTAATQAWSPAASRVDYQWFADGEPIARATKRTFAIPASAKDALISVEITGSRAGFESVQASSAQTTAVLGTLAAASPRITGSAKVGATLTAVGGAWTPGATLSYEWVRTVGKTQTVVGTEATYPVVLADKGRTLTLRVTGVLDTYATATKSSTPTKKVG